MSINFTIKESYTTASKEKTADFVLSQKYTVESTYFNESKGVSEANITECLSGDLDIFTEIPDALYKEKDVAMFLGALRKAIAKENPQNVTLAKLVVTEQTDTSCTLDWIYNYFRLYFSFDKKDGDYFGFMSFDEKKKSYRNEFKAMSPNDFDNVASAMLDYVLMMIQG